MERIWMQLTADEVQEFRKHIPALLDVSYPLTPGMRTLVQKFQAPVLFDETSEEQCREEILQEQATVDQPALALVHHVIRMGSIGTQLPVQTAHGNFNVTVEICRDPPPPREQPSIKVGIFWLVAGTVVVGDAVPLEQADYSDEAYYRLQENVFGS